MGSLRTAQGAFNSAFSVGQGYERQPLNQRASYHHVGRYFLDLRARTQTKRERVVTGRGEVLAPNATTLAQTAPGWWERHCDGERGALTRLLEQTDALIAMAERDADRLFWRYDVYIKKYRCEAPWYSSMAQGQAASALVRAFVATGRDRYAQAACSALEPLFDAATSRGMVTDTPESLIYEECPTDPASHILNGWIYTLWGLWDVVTALDASRWRPPFERSAQTLQAHLPSYDLGWWSRYSLFPRPDDDLAKPAYHVIHVDQLEVMYRLTGYDAFAHFHRRWRGYDVPANRCRAVAVKGTGVALDRLLQRK